jgi:hypothetical protein
MRTRASFGAGSQPQVGTKKHKTAQEGILSALGFGGEIPALSILISAGRFLAKTTSHETVDYA